MQTKKKMPSLTDSKSESLHFLHNSHPVSRGVSYTLIKFWALITKKFLYLTRSYNLLIFYIALPLCTTVFIPAYTCFRLNTEEKLVRGLDLRILNGSTVIYKTLFETNFSLRFERVYKLIFEDRIRPVHIDVKKVMKIPMSRDLSVRQDTHHSVDLILVGCKLITNMTGRNDSWIIAFYNSQFDYAEILSVVMALKAIARFTSQSTSIASHWALEPLPYTFAEDVKKSSASAHHRCRWIVFVLIVGLNALTVVVAMFIMTEYKHGFLRLQHISGMSHLDYFLSNFLFDFVLHTVEGFLICISLVWIRRYPAPMIYDASGFFVIIVLSALASLPCVYSIQMLFPSFKTFLCTYLLGRFSLDLFSMAIVGVFPAAMSIQDIRHILLRALYPPFNVFIELYSSCTRRSRPLQLMSEQFYSNNCTGEWSLLFPLQYVMFITLQFATWLLLVCIASAVSTLRKSSFCRSCLKALYLVNPTAFKETEVMNELIFIKDFQTIIKTAPHLVPNCNIRNNMVYGLIEPTGYVKMAFMRKFINYYAKSLCRHRTGYCPHDVALLDKLTCFETLKLFGRLRGLGTDDLYSQIKAFVAMLQFNSILHRRVSQINVQDKKKLYVAIALIGNPAILILDEPAELLDSMTTNLVWGMLRYLSRGHRFILIATKHAKGCENVCTNLSILFSNQLVVQSDTENLAVKYFHGYTAILKFSFINGQRSEHLKMCFLGLSDIFQDVEIYSDDKCTHVYFSSDDTDVSKLFAFLEDSKVYYSLWDYTITPTRLDEISYYLAVKATEQIIEILPDF